MMTPWRQACWAVAIVVLGCLAGCNCKKKVVVKEVVAVNAPPKVTVEPTPGDIAALDRAYQKLLRSIAEKMVGARSLTEEIKTAEANRKELADNLAALVEALEAKETPINYKGVSYPTAAKAQAKASRELTLLKQLDMSVGSKKKMLEAEQRNLDALKDQLDKLVTQKRASEIDEGQVAEIKKLLDRIEHSQKVDKTRDDLENQYGSKIEGGTAGVEQNSSSNVVRDVRDYLEGKQSKK
jgi:hypothetical protein